MISVNLEQLLLVGSMLPSARALSKVVPYSFQFAFWKLKRLRNGVLKGQMIGLISTPMGRCCDVGIGSHAILLHFCEILSVAKQRSGLYPILQRPLLKDLGSFCS